MNKEQLTIKILLILSLAIWIIPTIVFIFHRIVKPKGAIYRRMYTSHMLVISACLLGSIWCLRYAVGYYGIVVVKDNVLTLLEEIFNSAVHTFQTFSMDEEYICYILTGKDMIQYLFGENSQLIAWYGFYASVLNFLAPIAGGAVIFQILARVFPKITLYLSYTYFLKPKYYFSELNSASLALAKSIYETKTNYFTRPLIIFTDTYYDDDKEKDSELFLEAKLLGAICVRDDLAHVKKNRIGERKFFLIDERHSANVQTLVELANFNNDRYLKKTEIYLFTDDDSYIQIETTLNEHFKSIFKVNKIYVDIMYLYKKIKKLLTKEKNVVKNEEEKEKSKKEICKEISDNLTSKRLPIVIPVNRYRNLISNLLTNVPLYEPIVGKEKDLNGKQSLNVTILGIGSIGIEMFLSAYWFGQILDCKLNINILSQEEETVFWDKIDYLNPEIRHTTIKGDPILRYNREGDTSEEYCSVNYVKCDVKSSDFIEKLIEQEHKLLDTDYFFVSIGTDEDNISVANTIRRYVQEYHLNQNLKDRVVITYVVYNSELVDVLNKNKFFKYNDHIVDVYMQAVGSLKEVYDINNICMTKYEPLAQKVDDAYDSLKNKKTRADKHKNRLKDDYKHWSTLAQAMHMKYRIYSFGLIDKSIFDYPDSENAFSKKFNEIYDNYQKKLSDITVLNNEELTLLHRMAWLEHRRWNAFMRTKGFRYTDKYDIYAKPVKKSSYKQMSIKLHPCLIECDEKGIRAGFTSKCKINHKECELKCENCKGFDLLDEVSYDLKNKKLNDFDFKQFDYPSFDREVK